MNTSLDAFDGNDRVFAGNERFLVERRLGQGGFGVVYQVFDRHRKARVALKILRRPDALYQLKQEFRALADLSHPNLVSLYELLSDGAQSFITMELVEGTSFLNFVREGLSTEDVEQTTLSATTRAWAAKATTGDRQQSDAIPSPLDTTVRSLAPHNLDRLQNALGQLAEGLCFLHAAGKLHRDIKPSNVSVTSEGRVVLLDFGLVTRVTPVDASQSMEILGSPPYMAPEQFRGQVTEASDWYSVGIMLFQALTGRLPFKGTPVDVLMEKQSRDGPAPSDRVGEIPEALNELCRQLLARNPATRPSGVDILRRIGRTGSLPALSVSSSALPIVIAPPPGETPFVGREQHLAALADALKASSQGRTITVYVHGSSGMGKTALVRQFFKDLAEREPNVVLLAGRCYERESVPYKALDSVIDALTQYLRELPGPEAELLLPRDVQALARLFPVLRRVDAIVAGHHRVVEIPDSQELRRRAFAALRDLLARLGDRHPLVLFIDDLQWGDSDSAALLADLLRPPNPPVLLLIACYRSEEASTSHPLRTLLSQHPASGPAGSVRELVVGELSDDEARRLTLALVGAANPAAAHQADMIVRESKGNAFFINELARHSEAAASTVLEGTLDAVIQSRVARLPEGARRLLEILAVFGRPLERSVAARAGDLEASEIGALAALRVASLTRTRMSQGREEVEPYHDRIREMIVARLSPIELTSHHLRLAVALEAQGNADPETLAVHFHGAGNLERAASYAGAAAAQAVDTLAFERAARLYRLALDLEPPTSPAVRRLRVQLGDALTNAGLGQEAAHAYLSALEGATAVEAIELQRRAASQLFFSGQISHGLEVLRTVLRALGMTMAETPLGALASIVMRRAYTSLRGLGFRERDESQLSAEQLLRVDTCWSAAVGLALVDTIRGAEFQARHLLLALRTGEPYRVGRAIALQSSYIAATGVKSRHRSARLADIAQTLAERVNRPQALAFVTLMRGMSAYLAGEWKPALEFCQRAEKILRERCTGVAWELDTARMFLGRCLVYIGEIKEVSQVLPALSQEARARGDLILQTFLDTNIAYLVHLAADDSALARQVVREALERWSHKRFDHQHYWALHATVECHLYAGEGPTAWDLVKAQWPATRRSLMMRTEAVRLRVWDLRARAALAAGSHHDTDPRSRAELLRIVERSTRRIARERPPWAATRAQLTMAGLCLTRGRPTEARELLAIAERGFETAHMLLHAAAARRRRGEITDSAEGRALMARADAWMSDQSIRNPARMTDMIVPGRDHRS